MIRIFYFLLFLLLSFSVSAQDQYDVMGGRICYQNMAETDTTNVLRYMGLIAEDGGFFDLDYSIKDGDVWPARDHYYRLLELSRAYSDTSSIFYRSNELLDVILKGVNYWCEKSPVHSNWYFQDLEEPQLLGLITLYLKYGYDYNVLPTELEGKLIEHCNKLRKSPKIYDDSNKSGVALHWFYWGVIQKDDNLLETGLNTLYDILKYSDKPGGLMIDNSFIHDKRFYIGAYGEQFLSNAQSVIFYTHGTDFKPTESQMELLRKFFLNTYSSLVRGRIMAYNAMGRSVTYKGFLCNVPKRAGYAKGMIQIDEENKDLYESIYNRFLGRTSAETNVMPYHHHFWIGEYTVHTRKKFNFGCRFLSERKCRMENGLGEGLTCYYVSDGSTWLARTGEEYSNIMPLWDWNKVPGTTTPNLDPMPVSEWWTYGITDFVGGVNDSIYGCSAYSYFDEYSDINTGGNKGYFFFDDEVVCLGSNLSSTHDFCTTVEQNWGKDEVVVGQKDLSKTAYNGTFQVKNIENVSWVLHDSIGYFFPNACQIALKNDSVTGNWANIATTQEDKEIKGQVFLLTIPHQNKEGEKKNYEYVLLPGKDEADMEEYKINCPLQILNTDSVQIVSHSALKITECVFYRACQVTFDNFDIKVDNPCLLLIKEVNDSLIIHVADPRQKREPILVTISNGERGISDILEVSFDSVEKDTEGSSKKFVLTRTPASIKDNIYTSSDALVKIYSTSGKLLYNRKKINLSEVKSKLRPGAYIFEFENNNVINRRKVMIP